MILAVEATLPTTLWGWVAIAGVLGGLLGGTLGVFIRTGRAHIGRRVDLTCEEVVEGEVGKALRPIEVKIDTLGVNMEANALATAQGISRIEALEVTINNGLTHSTEDTKRDVEALSETVNAMQLQLSEMHGWMKASLEPT